jgi:flavin reductase (DIM6/NTAB) family NADH-FMN oxidoreductase RutF
VCWEEIEYIDNFDYTLNRLRTDGLIIVAKDANGKPNPMTIGWGTIGTIWGRPVWSVLVRPSRYTYQCVLNSGDFTVNVLSPEYKKQILYCGSNSGRDWDKLVEAKLNKQNSRNIGSPGIAEAGIIYECKVVNSHDLGPQMIDEKIKKSIYSDEDYHRVFYGEIITTIKNKNLK